MTFGHDDLVDLIEGAGFFGSGGGGSIGGARTILSHAPAHVEVEVVNVEDLPANALCAVPAFLGAPAAIGPETVAPASAAFRALSDWAVAERGQPLTHVMPGELGAINSLVACLVAGDLGLPVIDADGAGRSIPELTMATFSAEGASLDPTFLVSISGVTETIHPADASQAEGLARPIVERPEFGESAGLATWLMDAPQLATAAPIRGTLTLGRDLGRLLRTTSDPVASVLTFLAEAGRHPETLITGRITAVEEHTRGGFDFGNLTVTADDGTNIRVAAQNENLAAYDADGAVLGAIPDLLCFLTTDGDPFSHADLDEIGDRAFALIKLDPDPALRSPKLAPIFASALERIGH